MDNAIKTATETLPALTPNGLALLLAYAEDACNWDGHPAVGGNVTTGPWGGEAQAKGYLTELKIKGYIRGGKEDRMAYITFTPAGEALALQHGISIR